MKYLRDRSNYLQIVKERRDLQTEERINLLLENQAGSGVMGNEIKWGDCSLGRFLHNTIRKAQIGSNLARIRPVIDRLRGAMDDLLVSEQLNDLSEVDKAELNKALASEYIDVLRQAIDDFATAPKNSLYRTLESISNLTSDTIEKLKGTSATPYLGTGFEGKNEILRQLQKFKEEIDKWVEYEVSDTVGGQNPPPLQNQNQQQQLNPQQNALNAYQANLMLLLQLIKAWDKINRLRAKIFALQQAKQAALVAATPQEKQAKEADVVKVEAEIKQIIDESYSFGDYQPIFESDIESEILKREKELTEQWIETQKKEGKTNLKPDEGTRIRLKKQAEQEVKTGKPVAPASGGVKPVDKGDKPQSMVVETPIVKIMKQLWQIFLPHSQKGDKVGNKEYLDEWIQNFDREGKKNDQSDVQIRKIYDGVRKKLGLSNEEVKNESVADILNDTEKISALIVNLYNAIKSNGGVITMEAAGIKFPDSGVSFKSSDLKEKIKEEFDEFSKISKKFYTNMKQECLIEKLYIEKKVEKQSQGQDQSQAQPQAQKESKLFKYSDFILEYLDGINKKDDDDLADDPDKQHPIGDNRGKKIYTVGVHAKNDDRADLSVDLKSEWNKVFPNLSKYVISGSAQIEKLKDTLDKKLASQKDSIIIMGMDPVLEIVKCFNRAYKIHTTQVIASGRTGGEVTNKIFMEYTCFGSGAPANAGSGGGPYRNNKLFDLWESSVIDIMKDKQYQKIFNNATRLKVGDEYIEKAGANLRKFMNDMLNGDELYGKGDGKEGGAQAKFLDKYFGYKDGDDAKNTNFGGTEEREANMANTPEPMNIVLEEANKERSWRLDDLKYTFFAIKAREEGSICTMVFFVQDIDINTKSLIVSYCQSAYHMKKILAASGQSVKLSNDFSIDEEKKGTEPYPICATRIPINDFIDSKGLAKSKSGATVRFIWHEGCAVQAGRKDDCNQWDTGHTEEVKNWSEMRYYNIIDKSKGDTGERVKAPRIDKINDTIKTEGGFINSEIRAKVGNNNKIS